MLKDFWIFHTRKPYSGALPEGLHWETCLRSLVFSNGETVPTSGFGEWYAEREAYRFLLEVICGLHSPIVGETEVFGQFKTFSKGLLQADPRRAKLVQRLFTDAKALRTEHLAGLGHQSYGGWLKKNIRENSVHILGAGQLAREILPYLLKNGKRVTLHVREPSRVSLPEVTICPLRERAFDGGSLVVAAPMAAQEITGWLSLPPAEVFDLRDCSSVDPLAARRHVVLQDIFAQIESTKVKLAPVVERVKAEIAALSDRLASEAHVRPQGWDDICA